MATTAFVLPLDDPQATLERAGGKGSPLAKLAAAGLPVPGGFHLTTSAYREFVEVNALDGVIEDALETVDPDRTATLEDASTTIRKAFVDGSIPSLGRQSPGAREARSGGRCAARARRPLNPDFEHRGQPTDVPVRCCCDASSILGSPRIGSSMFAPEPHVAHFVCRDASRISLRVPTRELMSGWKRTLKRLTLLVGLSMIAAVPVQAVGGFGDVPDDSYYTAPVQWMADAGISSGTRPGCFDPDSTASRAEAATFIHRSFGSPLAPPADFSDVASSDFFAPAVWWMVAEGTTTGTDDGRFEPYRAVTRGEIATFLHRAYGSPSAGLAGFADVPATAFYAGPIGWMVAEGISTGVTPTTFEPNRAVTRAEIATFLYRAAGSPSVSIDYSGFCDAWPDLSAAEAESFRLLNELRTGLGLSRLNRDPAMDQAARDWSRTMDESGFRHSSLPYYENIAWWSADWISPEVAADRMHDVWVDSPGHYSNMTRPGHTKAGIGFWRSDDGWHATHVFSG